mmetsp:Transcript_48895/g.148793  ORF Transcript_48895/g.148793 Transcript_48895/m.148793 type:complete len:209 (+) Transcript_48895:5477-6103(+)
MVYRARCGQDAPVAGRQRDSEGHVLASVVAGEKGGRQHEPRVKDVVRILPEGPEVAAALHRHDLRDGLADSRGLPNVVAHADRVIRVLVRVVAAADSPCVRDLPPQPLREEPSGRHGDRADPDSRFLLVEQLAESRPCRVQLPEGQLDDVEVHAWNHRLRLAPDVLAQEAQLATDDAAGRARAGGLPLRERPEEDPHAATGLDHVALG